MEKHGHLWRPGETGWLQTHRKTTVKIETYHRSCEDSKGVTDQYKILKLIPRHSAPGFRTLGREVYFKMTRDRRLSII